MPFGFRSPGGQIIWLGATGAGTEADPYALTTRLVDGDVDLGAKADAAATTDTGAFSLISLFKRALQHLTAGQAKGTTTFSVATPSTSAQVLAANTSRKSALIHNAGSQIVYLGGSGVSTSTGVPLAPGATLIDNRSTSAWHGIAASGTGDLRIIEVA
jgi:hypothetical protein